MGGGQRWWSLPALVVLTFILLAVPAAPGIAAAEDHVESLVVDYVVGEDGTVTVVETIVLRFSASSTRHGLDRWLLTRRPYDEATDQLYQISDPVVTSPSGAPTQVQIDRDQGTGRERWMRVRIDPGKVIYEPSVSYRLSYTIKGALAEDAAGYGFSWDVTGSRFQQVRDAEVTLEVPGRARDPACYSGQQTSSNRCSTAAAKNDGPTRFRASDLAAGQSLTVSMRLQPAAVDGGGPVRVESAQRAERRQGLITLAVSAALGALVPLAGWWFYRLNGRDRRFTALPQGELPPEGKDAGEAPAAAVPVGVRTTPPELSLAEAGLLLTGQPDVRQTAATLIGLAVDGAVKLRGGARPEVRLVDARRARDRPSAVLLEDLFDSGETIVDPSANGVLAEGHERISGWAAGRAAEQEWFVRRWTGRGPGAAVIAVLGLAYVVYLLVGAPSLYALPLLVSLVVTGWILQRKLRHGARTGRGRAVTDRVEGFRNWLAGVDADELVAEAGDDVFSRLLPWAVLFDLTERWTRVCAELVASGQLSGAPPAWYGGTAWSLSSVPAEIAALTADITAAMTAPDFSGGAGSAGHGARPERSGTRSA